VPHSVDEKSEAICGRRGVQSTLRGRKDGPSSDAVVAVGT
jgi:hypothetical protein